MGSDNQGKVIGEGEPKYPIHRDSQSKHIFDHNFFKQELIKGIYKSIFETTSISGKAPKTAQQLVDGFAGTGRPVKPGTKIGDEGFKEVVDFRERVGFYYDSSTGNYVETNYGQIVYSKKGTHIIPANPVQRNPNLR